MNKNFKTSKMFAQKNENKVIWKNLEDREESFWKRNDEKKLGKKLSQNFFLEEKNQEQKLYS